MDENIIQIYMEKVGVMDFDEIIILSKIIRLSHKSAG